MPLHRVSIIREMVQWYCTLRLHLSQLFLNRIKKVPVKMVLLENASHYPIEQPGLDQMVEAIYRFYCDVALVGLRPA